MYPAARVAIAALLAGLLGFTGARIASAEEQSASADVEISVRATTSSPQPLLRFREEARDRLEELRENMRVQRTEVRTELRGATSSDERRTIIEEARGGRDEDRERREEIRSTVKQRIKAIVKTHVSAIYTRSENALSMFDNIIDRMESRIEKLQGAGANTASVEASLSASVALVDAAKADLRALQVVIDSVQDTSNAEDVRAELRAAIAQITGSVKAAHASLLETSKLLARVSANASAETRTESDD